MFSAPNPMYSNKDYLNCIDYAKIHYGGKHVRDAPYLIMEHPFCNSDVYLIYFHAKDEDINYAQQFIYEIQQYCKFNAIISEYPGYGIYQNVNAHDQIVEQDAIQLFDHIQDKYKLKNNQIIVFGRSIGTGPAFYINSLRQSRAVIVLSPFTSIKDVAKQKTFEWIANLIPQKFDNLQRAQFAKSPMLLIHGAQDDIIDKSHTETLFDQLPNKVKIKSQIKIRPDMTHNDFIFEHDIITPIQQFFPDLSIPQRFRY
ncbi:unnamed protein product [Paramecium sonneborni]|uniref:Peptidase S9 prolyl oligopeptidase catalytic domain-containing protein n=1 Tax=Paramecium sonneborni TaxID=65129 RepID=A0A8S1RIQ6_9CILI|nr:unnamed protein product [Paramecium sonneborni]